MNKLLEIRKHIKEIASENKDYTPFYGTVKKVEGSTCTVKISDSLDIPDVRLLVVEDAGDNFFRFTPKVGSNVMMLSNTGELDDLVIIKSDQIEKIEWKQDKLKIFCDSTKDVTKIENDKVTVEISAGKISIKNNNVSLLNLFQALSNVIKGITVPTGTGPSGTPLPPTIAQLQQFETEFKSLLK